MVVRTDELTKDFYTGFWRPRPHRALDRLTLEIPSGGIFGLLGPNGAGKSTTLKLLIGLLRPTTGRAELLGQGIGNLVAPLFGGITATAALARTATNVKAGAFSPVAAIVHAGVVLLAVLLLSPLFSYLPMSALAALLLMVAWNMSEAHHVVHTVKIAPRRA